VRDPNPDSDWTSEHDCLSEAIMDRHAVYGALIAETTFKIVEVLAGAVPEQAAPASATRVRR
jgi:hypothetical protein